MSVSPKGAGPSQAEPVVSALRASVPNAVSQRWSNQMSNVKTLDDVKADMSALYDQVRDGTTDIKTASELANITGKYLKAVQLDLATEIFVSNNPANRLAISHGK